MTERLLAFLIGAITAWIITEIRFWRACDRLADAEQKRRENEERRARNVSQS